MKGRIHTSRIASVLAPLHMKNLEEVDLFECELLVEIDGLEELGSLSALAVMYCRSLESLADTSNLDLECLQIVRCKRFPSHCSYCKGGRGLLL